MGYIDCDVHVFETDATWSYLDPAERAHRPMTVAVVDAGAPETEYWVIGDQRLAREDRTFYGDALLGADRTKHFPPGSVTLDDVPARLRSMDEMGTDVQVLISTFFLTAEVDNPVTEAALDRSYNRWLADVTSDADGRLPWVAQAPTRILSRAFEEMEFSKEHGAVGVQIHRAENAPYLNHEYYWPLYAKAEELGLAMIVHKAANSRVHQLYSGRSTIWKTSGSVIEAFLSVADSKLSERFPNLKWGFLEAGSGWLPFILQEMARSGDTLMRNAGGDVRATASLLEAKHLYVSCQMDDDLNYVSALTGNRNLVVGSDWGHLDRGSDPDAHGAIAARPDLAADFVTLLTDTNGRDLYDIDPAFRPSDAVASATAGGR